MTFAVDGGPDDDPAEGFVADAPGVMLPMAIIAASPARSVQRNLLRTRFIAGQVLVWLAVYAVYLGGQAVVADHAARAQANAAGLLDVEAALGLDVEHAVHAALAPLDGALAAYYLAGYVPVLVAGLLWLGLTDRRVYRRARRALIAAFGVGLVVFVLLPVAPPRLVPGLGLDDAAGLERGGGELLGLPYNEYAAFPSLHVGALILLAAAAVTATRSRALRALWLAQPALMAVAVVATGNHYVVDVLAGAAVGLALVPLAVYPTRVPRTGRRGSSPSPAARGPSWARANSRNVRVRRDSGRLPERTQ
jgi:membrane-associated phospholipid phosphatase